MICSDFLSDEKPQVLNKGKKPAESIRPFVQSERLEPNRKTTMNNQLGIFMKVVHSLKPEILT